MSGCLLCGLAGGAVCLPVFAFLSPSMSLRMLPPSFLFLTAIVLLPCRLGDRGSRLGLVDGLLHEVVVLVRELLHVGVQPLEELEQRDEIGSLLGRLRLHLLEARDELLERRVEAVQVLPEPRADALEVL